ncbi:MAG: hypothetical protein Q4G60_10575 [bacterium]|nr:hypothetical protein [bacterium]
MEKVIDKQFLKNFRRHKEEYIDQVELYRELNSIKEGSTTAKITGMPGGGGESDKISNSIISLLETEQRIKELEKLIKDEGEYLDSFLFTVRDYKQRTVIKLRYKEMMEWSEIRKCMYGQKRDYYDNESNYEKRTYKDHRRAIATLTDMSRRNGNGR